MRRHYRGSGVAGEPVDRNPGAVERVGSRSRPDTRVERAVGVAWRVVWELARKLPEPVAFGVFDFGARVAYRLGGTARRRVRANLSRVVDEAGLDAAVREAYRSYARYWVEAFRAADLDPARLDRRTTTDGFEHLDKVLEGGRGAIVLLAHHGSWDTAARWAESHRYHLAVVAEVLRPQKLFAKFVGLREAMGMEVVPLRRGSDLVGRLAEVLEANHLVGLLTDRDLTAKAPVTDFFGEPCRIPLGPAVLSSRTGAPIVPITMLQRPGRCWHLQVLEPIDSKGRSVKAVHADVVGALEQLILLDPAQWHAFQPVWLADLTSGKHVKARTAPDPASTAESA